MPSGAGRSPHGGREHSPAYVGWQVGGRKSRPASRPEPSSARCALRWSNGNGELSGFRRRGIEKATRKMSVVAAILVGIAGAWAACVLMPKMAYVLTSPDLYVASALPNGSATKTSDAVPTGMAKSNLPQKNLDVEWVLTAPGPDDGTDPERQDDQIRHPVGRFIGPDGLANGVYLFGDRADRGGGKRRSAMQTFRFRIPSTAGAWLGFRMTGSAAGDASGSTRPCKGCSNRLDLMALTRPWPQT